MEKVKMYNDFHTEKTEKFAEKWKNFTEKVNDLSLTIYDVIIRDRFFQDRQFSGAFHRLEKKNVPETASLILLHTGWDTCYT